jgi:hypothetical protein
MDYKIRLINRDVSPSAPVFPVCGKSGKTYGHATYDQALRGAIYPMSAADYERDKFDLIGNTAPMQQWVPEFQEAGAKVPMRELHAKAKQLKIKSVGLTRDALEAAIAEKEKSG